MLQLAWRGVRHNTGRYVATIVAIITGVAFFTATGFVGDGITAALEGDADRQYGGVDAAVVVDDGPDASRFGADLRIDGSVGDSLLAIDGVEAVGGDLTGSVAFLDDDGATFADGAVGRLWIADDVLNPIDLEEGVAPDAAGEVAIDRGTVDDERLEIGDRLTLLTLAGEQEVVLVGITSFGDADAQDSGGTVSIAGVNAFDWLNSGQFEYVDLYLRGDIDQALIDSEIAPLAPSGFRVQSGADFLQDKRDEVGAIGGFLKKALQGFAVLALFVGGFVIYNTFNVIVAQRLRELAVLAAIGATPKQIKRSLRFEGLAIGLIGSALGAIVGLGLAFVLILALELFGVGLPGSGIAVNAGVVVQGIVVGTLITYFSVTIPARRAARTEPIEAMRQSAVEAAPVSPARMIVTTLMIGIGIAGMMFGGGAAVALGALLLFVGVIVAGPIIALLGTRLFRPLLVVFGLEGRLAADNTARNPQRTATTANALLIGVFLVTLVTVAGTSVKDFAVEQIRQLSSADYVLQSDGGTIDDRLVDDLESIDGVDVITPFRREAVSISDTAAAISTGDIDALRQIAKIELDAGSFDDLGPGRILLLSDLVSPAAFPTDEEFAAAVGTTVTVIDSTGESVDLKVAGVVSASIDTYVTGSLVDAETFDAFVGETAPTMAFLDVQTGATTDTEDAISERVDLRPDINLTQGNELGRLVGQIFDFLINAVNGMLMMSVVVALIGIVNTLSLSILERRRELGLLRVIGMLDRSVQRMVRLESVLIAALGTVTGVVLGVFCGWATISAIDRLADADIAFTVPILPIAVVLVVGVALGFLASLVPARRSTRLDVLDALSAT